MSAYYVPQGLLDALKVGARVRFRLGERTLPRRCSNCGLDISTDYLNVWNGREFTIEKIWSETGPFSCPFCRCAIADAIIGPLNYGLHHPHIAYGRMYPGFLAYAAELDPIEESR